MRRLRLLRSLGFRAERLLTNHTGLFSVEAARLLQGSRWPHSRAHDGTAMICRSGFHRHNPIVGDLVAPRPISTPVMTAFQTKFGLLLGFIGMCLFAGTLPATRLAVSGFDPSNCCSRHDRWISSACCSDCAAADQASFDPPNRHQLF
jgi:hypothetical protein